MTSFRQRKHTFSLSLIKILALVKQPQLKKPWVLSHFSSDGGHQTHIPRGTIKFGIRIEMARRLEKPFSFSCLSFCVYSQCCTSYLRIKIGRDCWTYYYFSQHLKQSWGSGCSSVVRVLAYRAQGPWVGSPAPQKNEIK